MSGTLSVADVLDRAADLIEPEGAWTQLVAARDGKGRPCLSDNSHAVCFCAMGAIFRSGGNELRADVFFGELLRPGHGWSAIGPWNDAPERTQAEVVTKLREAAAIARATGGEA